MSFLPRFDSFDAYGTAQIGDFWTHAAGSIVSGRDGNGIQIQNGDSLYQDLDKSYQTLTRGISYKTNTFDGEILSLSNPSTSLKVYVTADSTGALTVHCSGISGTSSATMLTIQKSVFYSIQLQVACVLSSGTLTVGYQLRISGAESVAGSFSGAWAADAGLTRFGHLAPASGTCVIDNSYITDEDFLGDVTVTVKSPTADSAVQFTPSTGTNHGNAANIPAVDDSGYNRSTVAGDEDLFDMATPPAGNVVAMQTLIRARSESGQAFIQPTLKSGSDTAEGDKLSCGTSYTVGRAASTVSPFTGTSWSRAEVAAMTAGYTHVPAYLYRRSITIDHTKVPNTDQANFTMLFAGTYSWLATEANGGRLKNGFGYDVVFASDSAGTNLLPYERVVHDLATGEVEFHVFLSGVTLSHTSDTVIYVFYANASVSTDQSNTNGTWANGFLEVHHAQSALKDSARGQDLTGISLAGVPKFINPGAIEQGYRFDGTWAMTHGQDSGPYVTGLPSGSAERTLSCWVNLLGASTQMSVFGFGVNVTGQRWNLFWDSNRWLIEGSTRYSTFPMSSDSAWHLIHIVLPAGATLFSQALAYIDGVPVTVSAGTDGAVNTPSSSDEGIARLPGTFVDLFVFSGLLDECRYANVARSADWIKTEYNNQSSPSTFYSVGSETPNSVVTAVRVSQFLLEIVTGGQSGNFSRYAPVRR